MSAGSPVHFNLPRPSPTPTDRVHHVQTLEVCRRYVDGMVAQAVHGIQRRGSVVRLKAAVKVPSLLPVEVGCRPRPRQERKRSTEPREVSICSPG
jgi:hypothetical protein